ncbi:MAG: sugar lactone lactonase YvrE [Candidatus Azotimanducaceae bacterium]|jgi:sugar lactone lactonase YvrE
MVRILSVALIIFLTACGGSTETTETHSPETQAPEVTVVESQVSAGVSCDPAAGLTLNCGFENPEDLVIMPGGEKLLVSEMGEFMIHPPGALAMMDLASGARESIGINWQSEEQWGEVDCPVPDTELFSPHGIDLMQREDQRQQLLVVNHGGRESVEFFELLNVSGTWSLQWHGCALPPGDPFINDVAGLNDGGFFVTHMWDKGTPFDMVAEKLLAGEKTGWVYEWQADTGFVVVPNSIEMMPNGIAVNADNSKIFVNIYMASKTIRIDRASGEVDGSFSVQQPDNITVDETGMLWVASHKHDPINQTCTEPGVCLLPFEIVRADPETLETEVMLSQDGAPMGYVTVALRVGDKIYMGSAHGDRIASYPISQGL